MFFSKYQTWIDIFDLDFKINGLYSDDLSTCQHINYFNLHLYPIVLIYELILFAALWSKLICFSSSSIY